MSAEQKLRQLPPEYIAVIEDTARIEGWSIYDDGPALPAIYAIHVLSHMGPQTARRVLDSFAARKVRMGEESVLDALSAEIGIEAGEVRREYETWRSTPSAPTTPHLAAPLGHGGKGGGRFLLPVAGGVVVAAIAAFLLRPDADPAPVSEPPAVEEASVVPSEPITPVEPAPIEAQPAPPPPVLDPVSPPRAVSSDPVPEVPPVPDLTPPTPPPGPSVMEEIPPPAKPESQPVAPLAVLEKAPEPAPLTPPPGYVVPKPKPTPPPLVPPSTKPVVKVETPPPAPMVVAPPPQPQAPTLPLAPTSPAAPVDANAPLEPITSVQQVKKRTTSVVPEPQPAPSAAKPSPPPPSSSAYVAVTPPPPPKFVAPGQTKPVVDLNAIAMELLRTCRATVGHEADEACERMAATVREARDPMVGLMRGNAGGFAWVRLITPNGVAELRKDQETYLFKSVPGAGGEWQVMRFDPKKAVNSFIDNLKKLW